ncbi:MAG TPA: copper resistance protein CopC [Stellaceae bacterium]|nr:copper resistance protein CopC [Stellaceae bacterium]
MRYSKLLPLAFALSLVAVAPRAFAHAFPDHAQPAVGSTVSPAPSEVKIWFTGKLEPAFSKITVQDASGATVDKGDAAVDPQDATLMHVSLKKLPPGTYKVHWHAVSVDTHATEGDFNFTVK